MRRIGTSIAALAAVILALGGYAVAEPPKPVTGTHAQPAVPAGTPKPAAAAPAAGTTGTPSAEGLQQAAFTASAKAKEAASTAASKREAAEKNAAELKLQREGLLPSKPKVVRPAVARPAR